MTRSGSGETIITMTSKAPLPPRWFVRLFWSAHRRVYTCTRGRFGLWQPKPGKWGAVRLTTVGRRTGRTHPVIIGYFKDGPNLVTMAMNGWSDPEPAWWLNLRAHPHATIETTNGPRRVTARAAQGEERKRLWAQWQELDNNLDAYAARRTRETAVVVLEPDTQGDAMTTQVAEPSLERSGLDLEVLFPGRFISVTSFKRSGAGVATPVWAVSDGARLFALTDLRSAKVRRIRHNPIVTVAPCRAGGKLRGDPIPATAEILTSEADLERVQRLLLDRYRISYRVVMLFYRLGRVLRGQKTVADGAAVAITVTV